MQTCVQKPQWEAFGCRAHNVCLFILNQTDFDIVQTPGNKTPQMFSTQFCIYNSPFCTFLTAGGIFKHTLLAASAHSKHLLCCWKINVPLFERFSAMRGRARCQSLQPQQERTTSETSRGCRVFSRGLQTAGWRLAG